jgi:ABC-2 type transport system ATP-binding protein
LGGSGTGHEFQDYRAVLARAGLAPSAADARVSTFSKGMRQKLALAIAISRNSDVLILDEPMSGLDPFTVDDVTEIIVAEKERGKAVFMVTHELNSLEQIADAIGFMHQGRLTAELSRSEIQGKDLHAVYKSLLHASAAA